MELITFISYQDQNSNSPNDEGGKAAGGEVYCPPTKSDDTCLCCNDKVTDDLELETNLCEH